MNDDIRFETIFTMNDDIRFLATVTTEELPEYDQYLAELEANRDLDMMLNEMAGEA